jgi:hypothetical protein
MATYKNYHKIFIRMNVVVLRRTAIGLNLPAALCPGVDSASNRNEYQQSYLRVRALRSARKADSLIDTHEMNG